MGRFPRGENGWEDFNFKGSKSFLRPMLCLLSIFFYQTVISCVSTLILLTVKKQSAKLLLIVVIDCCFFTHFTDS